LPAIRFLLIFSNSHLGPVLARSLKGEKLMEKEPRIPARKMYKPEEIVNLLRLVLLPHAMLSLCQRIFSSLTQIKPIFQHRAFLIYSSLSMRYIAEVDCNKPRVSVNAAVGEFAMVA
jgi:hypothetical protein